MVLVCVTFLLMYLQDVDWHSKAIGGPTRSLELFSLSY